MVEALEGLGGCYKHNSLHNNFHNCCVIIRCSRNITKIYHKCERREYHVTVFRECQINFLIVELTCYYLLSHVFIAYTISLFINYY